jgi:hypothetical protein
MFSINLDVADTLKQAAGNTAISLSESTSMTEVLMGICAELQHYPKQICFSIHGFGKDWSLLEIDPDLCMLMEDLPGLISFLKKSDSPEYQFGFPEQHVQRMFTITRLPNWLKISCSDWLASSTEVSEELIQPSELEQLLHTFTANIFLVVDRVCPSAHANRFFQDWRGQVEI